MDHVVTCSQYLIRSYQVNNLILTFILTDYHNLFFLFCNLCTMEKVSHTRNGELVVTNRVSFSEKLAGGNMFYHVRNNERCVFMQIEVKIFHR